MSLDEYVYDRAQEDKEQQHDKLKSTNVDVNLQKPKPKKKKVKKEQENQGIRIAKQKKIQYLFRNICNPSGDITLQSLGHSLAKFHINFSISDLQKMLVLPQAEEMLNEESSAFDSESIREDIRNIKIKYEEFKLFYISHF